MHRATLSCLPLAARPRSRLNVLLLLKARQATRIDLSEGVALALLESLPSRPLCPVSTASTASSRTVLYTLNPSNIQLAAMDRAQNDTNAVSGNSGCVTYDRSDHRVFSADTLFALFRITVTQDQNYHLLGRLEILRWILGHGRSGAATSWTNTPSIHSLSDQLGNEALPLRSLLRLPPTLWLEGTLPPASAFLVRLGRLV